jgi:putative endonuclease
MAEHNQFGKLGEQKVIDFLKAKNYRILARNYRYLKAEIDIVAQHADTLVVVEVKSRNKGFYEELTTTISSKKIKLLTMAANQFIQENDLDLEVRFDVVTVIKNGEHLHIEHLENAFYFF